MTRTAIMAFILALFLGWPMESSFASDEASQTVRPPAVAGRFYPNGPEELRKTVRSLLRDASGVDIKETIRGLVSPHAGYIYSGIVAAAGYRQIAPSTRTVILIGPSHQFPLKGASIPSVAVYQTPLGDVRLAQLVFKLRKLPIFESAPEAHKKEHSLEVQLPFLQVMLKDFEIVPILINSEDPKALALALAPHIDNNTLIVASTDLSHYYPYERAVSLDRVCTSAITNAEFSRMSLCEACGKQAVMTLMHIAEIKNWDAKLIDYKNSGDTAGGKDNVVGYASIAFVDRKERSKRMKASLSDQDKKALLRLARSAIEAKIVVGIKVERPKPSPILKEDRGCFVTLHKFGQLRGCIGTIEPVCSLVECVGENAQNAAFKDPRFLRLSAEELPEIDIEVSVLSVPERLNFKNGDDLKCQLRPNVHGVILSRGMHSSTFLPQVWEQLPDKEQFLEYLCVKGGMPATAWKDSATKVEVYQAEVFGEKDFK
ncbi:MAG: AmmeMemoRadiSam system protein B [Deltaproteobacteria bacterium]|nr:AmmeMemoRadiSam system protein B [Deltaproteobacteria bacterium]MBW1931785.1 AmmeMemoRadiSam system protein B [Deltaproteobacteria bacterium]MBW1963748.1 AmmeMemoRadiSam system protein B [Deltaproteobacteria bacterium]MBW2349906.1 AmmeMemoRadiSam system protein B [Deltaproteobacteria bacterium]